MYYRIREDIAAKCGNAVIAINRTSKYDRRNCPLHFHISNYDIYVCKGTVRNRRSHESRCVSGINFIKYYRNVRKVCPLHVLSKEVRTRIRSNIVTDEGYIFYSCARAHKAEQAKLIRRTRINIRYCKAERKRVASAVNRTTETELCTHSRKVSADASAVCANDVIRAANIITERVISKRCLACRLRH